MTFDNTKENNSPLYAEEWNDLMNYIGLGMNALSVDYRVFKSGLFYYARNGNTGLLAYNHTDFITVMQWVVDALGVEGGTIALQRGLHIATKSLVPFPSNLDATGTLVIIGEGEYNTIIKADDNFNVWGAYTGLIGYGKSGIGNLKVHQLILANLTLDGNYSGVADGENGQPESAGSALISLPQPHDGASSPTTPAGIYHKYFHVRFYRPPAYAIQGSNNITFLNCLFDACGQPDGDNEALHYDIIGGGDWARVKVLFCEYAHSSGNYVDLVAGTSGRYPTLIFIGNEAEDHGIGGIYALGKYSRIIGNHLHNYYEGSGIGYDSETHEDNRAYNIVVDNVLQYVAVGLWDYSAYGDIIRNNAGWKTETSGTATIIAGQTSITVAHGLSVGEGAYLNVEIVPTTNIDGKFYWVEKGYGSFVIHINSTSSSNIDFDYTIKVKDG